MTESILKRPIDTDGRPSRYVFIAALLGIVALIAGWMSVFELQFMMFAKTIEGELQQNGQVKYVDGDEAHLDRVMSPDEIDRVGPTQIEILPGVGHARLPGTRYFMPFVVFFVSLATALLLLIPVLKQANEYSRESEDRDETNFDWRVTEDR